MTCTAMHLPQMRIVGPGPSHALDDGGVPGHKRAPAPLTGPAGSGGNAAAAPCLRRD